MESTNMTFDDIQCPGLNEENESEALRFENLSDQDDSDVEENVYAPPHENEAGNSENQNQRQNPLIMNSPEFSGTNSGEKIKGPQVKVMPTLSNMKALQIMQLTP